MRDKIHGPGHVGDEAANPSPPARSRRYWIAPDRWNFRESKRDAEAPADFMP
jgi:hypothetical protein